jgi:hypothetical protein
MSIEKAAIVKEAKKCVAAIERALADVEDNASQIIARAGRLVLESRKVILNISESEPELWMVGRQDWYVGVRLGSKALSNEVQELLHRRGLVYHEPQSGLLWVFPKSVPPKQIRELTQ